MGANCHDCAGPAQCIPPRLSVSFDLTSKATGNKAIERRISSLQPCYTQPSRVGPGMPSKQQSGVISFGSFQLDPDTGSLEKHGVRVRLPRQPARILTLLAQRAGTVITREELREQVWSSDTFVDFEHGLNAAINKLRQALGDSAEKPRFIETLPGRGYRFVAAVRIEPPKVATQEAPAPEPVPAPSPIQVRQPAPRRLSWPLLLAFGGLAAALLVVATWAIAHRETAAVHPLPATFTIPAPEGFAFQPAGVRQAFAISPDGSRLAFTAMGDDGQYRLWIRDLASLEPREVPAARGAHTVFWSPGGDALYFGVDRSLRRVTPDARIFLPKHQRPDAACASSGHVDRARSHPTFVSAVDRSGARGRWSSDDSRGRLSLAAGSSRRQAPFVPGLRSADRAVPPARGPVR